MELASDSTPVLAERIPELHALRDRDMNALNVCSHQGKVVESNAWKIDPYSCCAAQLTHPWMS